MANLIAVMAHCDVRGSEIIVGSQNHIVVYEQGGCATIAGVHSRIVPTQMEPGHETPIGGMALEDIEKVCGQSLHVMLCVLMPVRFREEG